MKSLLRRCVRCWAYTLKDVCPRCGDAAKPPIPPKYSPDDRYKGYRRRLRKLTEVEKDG
ncbi:MAG: RNA-protein complex protein Nop10 [Candidatus Thermoplasmatota archaeon]